MPHYERAQQVCGGGVFGYAPEPWEDEHARQLPLQSQGLETGMFHFSPFEVFTNPLPAATVRCAQHHDLYACHSH